jgi:hypothetical protein
LQVDFLWTHKQAPVIVNDPRKPAIKMLQSGCSATPRNRHWNAAVHSRPAPLGRGPNVWRVILSPHRLWCLIHQT